jgi:hypothetical protein
VTSAMILFNILIQQQGTRIVTCLICLYHLFVSFTVSVCFLCLFLVCLSHLSIAFACLIYLSHLLYRLSFFVFLLVLCTAHLYVSLAVCSVYFICLPNLSSLSAVCLNCLFRRLSNVFFSLCLSIFLTCTPFHLAHSNLSAFTLYIFLCLRRSFENTAFQR